MVFVEKRKYKQTIAWYIVLNFLPVLGNVLYLIFAGGLNIKTKTSIINKKHFTQNYYKYLNVDSLKNITNKLNLSEFQTEIVDFVENNFHCMYSSNNSVQIFTNGIDNINALKKDLLAARKTINIQYYIFANDGVGNEIMQILCNKAMSCFIWSKNRKQI